MVLNHGKYVENSTRIAVHLAHFRGVAAPRAADGTATRDGWAVLGDELARRVPARRRGDRGIDVRDRRQRIHRAVRAVVGEEVSERGGRGD